MEGKGGGEESQIGKQYVVSILPLSYILPVSPVTDALSLCSLRRHPKSDVMAAN